MGGVETDAYCGRVPRKRPRRPPPPHAKEGRARTATRRQVGAEAEAARNSRRRRGGASWIEGLVSWRGGRPSAAKVN
ncbi:hypothetical protein E2562_018590 [Oryza meyeriana var. granulata]|uniref:Uncharacterized protein n=1 Tax=Oryza meyeriana var. granulata TaxID=110450 RepID=A0A6G1F9B8_9ORYZ|nr:hypothetical protein E2562_018590 [Oryza meyeriana var. granulata]